VDCNLIRQLIAEPLAGAPPIEQHRLLGRAMARVLAHEMYHVLTNSTKHGTHGIAKAAYSCAELAADHLSFEGEQIRRGRGAKADGPPVMSPGTFDSDGVD